MIEKFRMSRSIIKIKDQYLVWSTVSDSPVTIGMSQNEIEQWTLEQYGKQGLEKLPDSLARADAKGCSALDDDFDLEAILLCNRAGKDETHLSEDQIYQYYCVNKWEGEPPIGD